MKQLGTIILTFVCALTLMSCKTETNIPVGVYELPANEKFDVNAAPGHLVIVDFNATWCGPCQRFAPVFKQAAEKYQGKVQFVSVDVDQHPELAQELGIRSIPALLFISPDGKKDMMIGAMEEDEFDSIIEKKLNK